MTASDLTTLAASLRAVLILDADSPRGVSLLPVLSPAAANDPDTIVVATNVEAVHYLRGHRTAGEAAKTATIDIRLASMDIDVVLATVAA